ncbi:MAG: Bcr/CflA family drug resistance efflux transporter, partial [Parvibaculum sp.]
FGVNAAGLIAASQVNAFLLRRHSGRTILKFAMTLHLAAALALLAVTLVLPGAFYPLAACIFVVVASYGFVGANATAAAMSRAEENAGSAAALTGILQFALAATVGGIVGAFNDGTALPMAIVIALGSIMGTLVRLTARERAAAPA